jgi:hypothetical protein
MHGRSLFFLKREEPSPFKDIEDTGRINATEKSSNDSNSDSSEEEYEPLLTK